MPPRDFDLPLLRRFILVGGSTAVLCLGLTYGLVEGVGIDPTPASTLALFVAVLYNYILHYHWTFGADAPHGIVLVKYIAMCLGAMGLNALVMEVGVSGTGLHYSLIQMVAAVFVVLWSMSISAIWVFR